MPLAEVQIACIRRYASAISDVPIFIATEISPTKGSPLERILKMENTHYIKLQKEESGFIESRLNAVMYLPEEFKYVLPLQEDFWLDRAPDYRRLVEAIEILKADHRVKSIRLMPSPGPHVDDEVYTGPWRIIGSNDTYKFTFQATMWRPDSYRQFMEQILKLASKDFRESGLPDTDWSKFCIRINVAENIKGQTIFTDLSKRTGSMHLCIERKSSLPNAVYLAPWPYRPTAVVQGCLEPWAKEFAEREGFKLSWP
jgi:hypothetical protein